MWLAQLPAAIGHWREPVLDEADFPQKVVPVACGFPRTLDSIDRDAFVACARPAAWVAGSWPDGGTPQSLPEVLVLWVDHEGHPELVQSLDQVVIPATSCRIAASVSGRMLAVVVQQDSGEFCSMGVETEHPWTAAPR